jgi:hypothetical protein
MTIVTKTRFREYIPISDKNYVHNGNINWNFFGWLVLLEL